MTKRRLDTLALSTFTAMALVWTGPALFSPGPSVAALDTTDTWLHLWAFWRIGHAMAGHDAGYFISNLITYPEQMRTIIAVFDPLLPLLAVPLHWAIPDTTTLFNLLTLLGLVFTAMAGYWLAGTLGAGRSVGLVAGTLLAFNPFIQRQILGGFTEYSWWGVIPLALLLYLRSLQRRDRSSLVLYGLVVLLTFSLSIYCAIYLFLVSALLLLYHSVRVIQARQHRTQGPSPGRIIKAQAVAVLFLAPLLALWLVHLARPEYKDMPKEMAPPSSPHQTRATEGQGYMWERMNQGSLDLSDLLFRSNSSQPWDPQKSMFPRRFETAFGLEWLPVLLLAAIIFFRRRTSPGLISESTTESSESSNSPGLISESTTESSESSNSESSNSPGLISESTTESESSTSPGLISESTTKSESSTSPGLISDSITGLIPGPWFWGVLGLLFLILALGPSLQWGGEKIWDGLLPYGWLVRCIPWFSRLVVPGRTFLVTILCLTVLVVWSLDTLPWSSITGRLWFHLAAALVLFFTFPMLGDSEVSLPVTRPDVPEIYRQIGEEQGKFALLELPTYGDVAYRMYLQTIHHRPIYRGEIPDFFISVKWNKRVQDNALVSMFEFPDSSPIKPEDMAGSIHEVGAMGFKYLIVHRKGYHVVHRKDFKGDKTYNAMKAAATKLLGAPLAQTPDMAAWKLPVPPGP